MSEDILSIYRRWLQWCPINEDLAAQQKEAVMTMARAGKTGKSALEVAYGAMVLADHLISAFEWTNALPQPIACQSGCPVCCFNQVELTPLEALVLGDYVSRYFPPGEQTRLLGRIDRNLKLKAGKDKKQIAAIRHKLPCPFLKARKCSVYPVRPLLCRAMHSLNADHCRQEIITPVSHFEFYSHRYEIVLSLSMGLKAGCQDIGCQSQTLDLARVVKDFLNAPNPVEDWIKGKMVFSKI
jgi:Fe-S-cluster containining protein